MKLNFCILTLVFSLVALSTKGQAIPRGLSFSNIQNEILQMSEKYDSLVFIDRTNFWFEDFKINGIGFKGNERYWITIFFKEDTLSSNKLTFRKIKRMKVRTENCLASIDNMDYSEVSSLNNDSLNLRSRSKAISISSDGPEWTILVIKNGRYILTQSYDPETYQRIAPTLEREIFINVFKKLEELIE